jgi:hypothetical protein
MPLARTFYVRHTKLLATVDAETLKQGRIPKQRKQRASLLRAVAEPATDGDADPSAVTTADPSTVRPSLALAAGENLEQLTASLLEAAGSAVKPVWLTVECARCGERSQVEAPIPDVRSRVAAIELLLTRRGWGVQRLRRTCAPRGCRRTWRPCDR